MPGTTREGRDPTLPSPDSERTAVPACCSAPESALTNCSQNLWEPGSVPAALILPGSRPGASPAPGAAVSWERCDPEPVHHLLPLV